MSNYKDGLLIETYGHQILLTQGISSARKLINTKDDIHQSLLNKAQYKLFVTDMEQIIIFWNCHQFISSKIYAFAKADIIDKIDETGWSSFCNTYIGKEI